MKPATAWRKVARMGRVAIKDGTFIGGHNMSGATGTLWRVTTGGQGWVMMDEPLPEDLQSFPGNDHRLHAATTRDLRVRTVRAQVGGGAVTARCPTCDREGCAWFDAARLPGGHAVAFGVGEVARARRLVDSFVDCCAHRVDWRARALAARAIVARLAEHDARMTTGPWSATASPQSPGGGVMVFDVGPGLVYPVATTCGDDAETIEHAEHNAAGIAAIRNALPDLLAALEIKRVTEGATAP